MHKYSLRQMVRFARPGASVRDGSTSGTFEITRLMPADASGEASYWVKSVTGGQRAVRESEIVAGHSGS